MNAVLSHDEFREVRFFRPLDGIRAISVVLVIFWHMPEKDVLGQLNGWSGVTMFFVLSGFLITTLCLREAERSDSGRFDLLGFYVRRVFRILPLYFFTVLLAAVLVSAFGLLGTWTEFKATLGYYLTLSVDLIHQRDQPLRHTWSLGVEEKFYLLWPLALIVLLRLRKSTRVALAAVLAVLFLGAPGDYLPLYFPITVGCLLAFALDWDVSYTQLSTVAGVGRGIVLGVLLASAVVLQLAIDVVPAGSRLYALVTAAAIGAILIRERGRVAGVLGTPAMAWVGDRSYGIYLLHPIAIHATDRLLAPDDTSPALMAIRLSIALVGSFVAADLAHRFVEQPFRDYGRELSKRLKARTSAAATT